MASRAGRRGTKRKAEAQEEEKPSVEEKKEKGGGEEEQGGLKVVIEHCFVPLICWFVIIRANCFPKRLCCRGFGCTICRNLCIYFSEMVKAALLTARPELTVVLNPEKPRRNSFEITLLVEGKETSLWTGIKKGPPRKQKFPEPDVVVSALQDALKAE